MTIIRLALVSVVLTLTACTMSGAVKLIVTAPDAGPVAVAVIGPVAPTDAGVVSIIDAGKNQADAGK